MLVTFVYVNKHLFDFVILFVCVSECLSVSVLHILVCMVNGVENSKCDTKNNNKNNKQNRVIEFDNKRHLLDIKIFSWKHFELCNIAA